MSTDSRIVDRLEKRKQHKSYRSKCNKTIKEGIQNNTAFSPVLIRQFLNEEFENE